MLGVSSAATVAFNFQCDYCGAASYSGAVVTAPAFGVGVNAWESLTQMKCGYGCSPAFNALSEVVDATATTSGTPGLHALPNGSITVSWSAYTANVSGFGGYDRSAPHYTFGGNGYHPGNEQAYWGFLRDGVNFGPGSSGGNNDQPGYQIDLVGLKSLFTNSAFAVQLFASADSMQFLTNAFVIDATAGTTQSVVYAATPPVGDAGDTSWVRGVGGGLSTASGAVNTDHLQIIGNRAAHVPGKVTGYNFASTISGFIITDQPVISMPPNSLAVVGGDTLVLSAYAVGVPPMAYQWRLNGTPIPGATNLSYTNAAPTIADAGAYDLVVTNLYGSAVSAAATVTVDRITFTPGTNFVVDSNPGPTEHDGRSWGATWLASAKDGAGITRNGVMSFQTASPGQVVVPGHTNFNTATGTITFWANLQTPPAAPATLFDRAASSDGLLIVQNPDGTVTTYPGGAPAYAVPNFSPLLGWHHLAVSFDQAGGVLNLYVDGALANSYGAMPDWNWTAGQEIELGSSHNTNYVALDGMLSDVRFYNEVLTDAQVAAIYSTGTLAVPAALILQLGFSSPPEAGAEFQWQATDVILQSSGTADGTYTDQPGATSPYNAAAQGAMKFFRYRGHTPQTLISNPFLM